MSAILNKFRRSSVTSGDHHRDHRARRSASASSSLALSGGEDDPNAPLNEPNRSPQRSASGSLFVEHFDRKTPSPSKPGQGAMGERTTPSHGRPTPLEVPGSGVKLPAPGTPKLMLTKEGSNSPRSFTGDSPSQEFSPDSRSRESSVGLGLGRPLDYDDDIETPTTNENFPSQRATSISISEADLERDRRSIASASTVNGPAVPTSASMASMAAPPNGVRSRSGSIVSRVTSKIGHPSAGSPVSLRPVDDKHAPSVHSSGTKKSSRRQKRDRRRSIASTMSANSGVAAALAKSGLHIASPTGGEDFSPLTAALSKSESRAERKHRKASQPIKRSPFLSRRGEEDGGGGGGGEYDLDDEDGELFDDDDDSDSDLGDDLPVTGFAVASNRRNADFHALFPSVDEGDYLIEDYGCALSKDILVQGRLYVSENHICFHANIFGWVTDVVIAFTEIKGIEKKMTALVIPNAIGVTTPTARYTFASLIARDNTYDVMMNIWRLCNPNAVLSSVSLSGATNAGSRPVSVVGDENGAVLAATPGAGKTGEGAGAGGGAHAPTQCACGKGGKHYPETALETTFPSTPEKVYNLMFNSGWYKSFLSDNQKLKDIEYSDWRPVSPDNKTLTRSTSYVKPLNGSIGPKQTTCHITDEREHYDPNEYIVMVTTTRTPDVPSGGVFSVKTRTCLMWAGANSTKVVVTTGVEWTGKSWIKGIIEKSAIDGQKTYHDDLKVGMLAYIQDHLSEFLPPGASAPSLSPTSPTSDSPSPGTSGAPASPTAAQEYAARARKSRQEHDYWTIQRGVDLLFVGGRTVGEGLKTLYDAVSDLLSDRGWGQQGVMAGVIVILVLSNIWTYLSVTPSSSSASGQERLRPARGKKAFDEEVAEAVRLVMSQRALVDPLEEARELVRMLDGVEGRSKKLREEVEALKESAVAAKAAGGKGKDEVD
ncbi:hypothetical protein IAT38_008235 [Cryptococcus sp. DSM 104549]